jgi:hypothetical protein
MSNDSSTNPEEALPCFALSKNDSYLMSASGGMVSLFNVISFKVNSRPKYYSRIFLIVFLNFIVLKHRQ